MSFKDFIAAAILFIAVIIISYLFITPIDWNGSSQYPENCYDSGRGLYCE